jgi:hypothetical protein
MESDRTGHSMRRSSPRRQAGVTVIGFLLLAAVFGAIGLAVLKIVPLYLEKMRVRTVLEDLQTELSSGTNSVQSIRLALEARLYVENLRIPREEVQIAREGEGYVIRIDREARAPFIADLSFVVDIDEQIELGR